MCGSSSKANGMRPLLDSSVAIIGLGLMGGSLALALRQRNACRALLGVDVSADTRAQADASGAFERTSADLALVDQADIVILATPVQTILELLPHLGSIVREGTLVMDLGSTKRQVVHAMAGLAPRARPIGGHPMCGKETSGFGVADPDLFKGAAFALVPLERNDDEAYALAESLARAVEARPIRVDPVRHDRIVAATSHLPFALASTLMALIGELAQNDELILALVAGGFRDTSRLAASEPSMMLDVLLTNADNTSELARTFAQRLTKLADLIERKDRDALRTLIQAAAKERREVQRS